MVCKQTHFLDENVNVNPNMDVDRNGPQSKCKECVRCSVYHALPSTKYKLPY